MAAKIQCEPAEVWAVFQREKEKLRTIMRQIA